MTETITKSTSDYSDITEAKTALEPIAIVGVGCRFPGGANSPQAFWKLLAAGADGIREVPPERWDIDRFYSEDMNAPGKMYVRKGGFLEEPVDRFDAGYFGISPREANNIDPQQRLLLEVAVEAMEDAGIPITGLAGSDTGVFIGGFTLDSLLLQMSPLNRENIGSHSATGASMTMLANRLSYSFDLRGPSLSTDTACSSSLVAVHLACQAIWRGECSAALAGGVNVMLRPEYPIVMSKGHFLSPDGYCKSFDERANGYARGEGAGVVILKPLSAALRADEPIYALIRGTGVNQDGRTDGITVPNPEAQEALIREIYARYNVPLNEVRYVEAHGTGTPVGDPIEASVLGRTFGSGRNAQTFCVVGSAKAAIGHLEAAAGIAGVIKASLCLREGAIPPQANLGNPNPKIPFETLGIRLPRALEKIPDGAGKVYVGVNSFGYGGTNAHAILEAPPARGVTAPREENGEEWRILPLSARSPAALSALARAYAQFLADADAQALSDICYSASVRRAHYDHRLAVVADSAQQFAAALETFAEHGRSERVVAGKPLSQKEKRPVFVFTGMGPQWWRMGRELLESDAAFRKRAEGIDAIFKSLSGWSILKEMLADEESSRMKATEIAQPANFVLQVALADFYLARGVLPAAVVGHSVGEVSAAYVSGMLSLEDAVAVSYHRSRLQQRAAGKGRMLATGLSAEQAVRYCEGREDRVSIAAVNSPAAVTLAGDADALAAIAEQLERAGVFNRFLQVEVAYHSPQMDALKPDLRKALEGIRPTRPSLPLYSTVTGREADDILFDGEYWCDNIRNPVLFGQTIESLLTAGHNIFLEVGPHPVLGNSIKEAFRQTGVAGATAASLRRGEPELPSILTGVGELHVHGAEIDWRALSSPAARYVKLPSYPWQRESYWNESAVSATERAGSCEHPLLGLRAAAPTPTWECATNRPSLDYIADHVIDGVALFPGAGYLEQGLALHSLIDGAEAGVLEDVEFRRPLIWPAAKDARIRVTFDEKSREYSVFSQRDDDAFAWTLHASGRVSPVAPHVAKSEPLDEIKARCGDVVEGDALYETLAAHGLQYGPAFRRVTQLRRGAGEVLAELRGLAPDAPERASYLLHPALVDAAVQSLIGGVEDNADTHRAYLPVAIRRVACWARPPLHCWSHGRINARTSDTIEGDIRIYADDGSVVAELLGVKCQAIASSATERAERIERRSYAMTWIAQQRRQSAEIAEKWLVFSDENGFGAELTRELRAQGVGDIVEAFQPASGPASKKYFEQALDAADGRDAIVFLFGLDTPETNADPNDADPSDGYAGGALVALAQALAERAESETSPRLYVVTSGAQQVDGEPVTGLGQAYLVGLARSALSEHPNLRCTLVDIDATMGLRSLPHLARELASGDPETDVALRGEDRYVHRLAPWSQTESNDNKESEQIPATEVEAFEIAVGSLGRFETLRYRETPRRAPEKGEIELQIRASALNFKDVLKVLGMLPAKALESTYHSVGLGMEAAGVVTAVGEGVDNYKVGDAVVASVRGSFNSHVVVSAEQIFGSKKLDGMTFEEAASLPVIFMTAYYALHEIGRLQKGETVLIHAAAGGVGLAAIQVAKWLGATIIATAGSDEKRAYLRSLGVDHIFNSRTLDFADEILALTKGRGVDVVLNSLSGEPFLKSLAVTAPLGRFIEIGKRDIVENARMPMLPFNQNLSFTAIDLDRIMMERPGLIRHLFEKVWERFRAGDFTPTPIEVFPAAEIGDAFRHMAQSKQIGKIVISYDDLESVPVLPRKERTLVREDATYLVTGGLGGFGLKVAQWLASEGAGHLALVGRSGARTPEARETVRELRERGIVVNVVAADIGEETDVISLLEEIGRTMPPLRGVFHAAAVLDDTLLVNLDEERFRRVTTPKARGAWLLHKHTQDLPIDLFVLFSSISALVGNPGQANYVAANAFLDSLAHHRRAAGLPATSINWGALAEVGMLAADKQVADHLARIGIEAISPADAIRALKWALERDIDQFGFMDVDWSTWRQFHPAAAASPVFARLIDDAATQQGGAANQVRSELLAAAPGERLTLLAQVVAEMVAETMRMPTDQIDVGDPLTDMGIDSLMAVELQVNINSKLGVEFPVLELIKGGSIAGLAKDLLARMNIASETNGESDAAPAKTAPATEAFA